MSLPPLALIGGTSLLETSGLQQAEPIRVETDYGPVELLRGQHWLFLQRHGLQEYTPPHAINHHAHFQALQKVGVKKILALGSVGSLRHSLPPGTLVIPDDFYAPMVNPSYFKDARGHRPPGFHPAWRSHLVQTCQRLQMPQPVAGGVYWQTPGPRFETPVEIRFHQPHCHVVGMTIASECILAGELELPYAALCMVDNLANGLSEHPLSYESFRQQVRENHALLHAILPPLLQALQEDAP
ncbi:MAG: MTAP family purine nucleoside phosphorylase [Magnetococcales bacterium]|nr:MTAP family purine nucleoside phosphorylase [Magnetococcales bacterium]NGZ28494.1 MTAP family purine nucleoside phosphorylase [Magnetococcales bacterium]